MRHFITSCFTALLLLLPAGLFAQVVVTSSDSLSCFVPCTVLSATFTGDNPTDAGITIDDQYPDSVNPIGFTFKFYGVSYTSCLIGPNGTICFNVGRVGLYDDWHILGPLLGNPIVYNSICGPWCDIDIEFGGTITYSTDGAAPNRRFVVTFCHDAMYDTFTCAHQFTTTQMILYETTNIIEVHVGYKDTCTAWNHGYAIIGVQNATGTAATAAPGRDYPSVFLCLDEAWRFTPVAGGTSYAVTSIPYAPVPYASSLLYWYNNNTGAYLGTGAIKTVCPSVPTLYKAGALGCSDTSFGYYLVTPGSIAVTTASANPSLCGVCDGRITVSGLTPGLSDTLSYDLGGVPQPAVVATVPGSGMVTLTGLCAGTYSNISVKQGVCVSPPATIVLSNPAISATVTTTSPSQCGVCDGSLVLHGLYPAHTFTVNYTFNGVAKPAFVTTSSALGTITISGLCAGIYDNIVASFGACVTPANGPYSLTDPPIAISSVTTTLPTVCDSCDGIIVLNGLYASHTFTVTYTFNGSPQPPLGVTSSGSGTITLPGLCSGTYDKIAAAFGSCVTPAAGPYSLGWPPGTPVNLTSYSNPTQCGFCDGEIIIKPVPPYSTDTLFYSLNGTPMPPINTGGYIDSAIHLPGLCAGSYTDFSVKSGHCIHPVAGSATLVAPPLSAAFTDTVHYGCHGDSVFYYNKSSSAGPLRYVWSFGDFRFSDTAANPVRVFAQGVYTVTLMADNGVCIDSMKKVDSLVNPLHAGFSVSPDTLCQKMTAVFSDSSTGTAISYAWDFGNGATDNTTSPSFTYNDPGVYHARLIVTDFVPCSDTVEKVVVVDPASSINIAATDTTICAGGKITLDASYLSTGNRGLVWSLGNGDSIRNENPVTIAYDSRGQFKVGASVYYRVCAAVSASRTVTVFAQPELNLGPDTSICAGGAAVTLVDNINSGNHSASWVWSTYQTTPAILVTEPGIYFLTVSISGCRATDTVVVKNDCYINIPNVFTPNGDGVNDYFFPRQYLARGLVSFAMNIYNRWGQLIFETNTTDGAGWDGRFNNVPQPEGVYIYLIEAVFKDGQQEKHQGNVTLLR